MSFLNLSNHPCASWSSEQLAQAHHYGEIVDIPFPSIDPMASSSEVHQLALHYVELIKAYDSPTVHLMGEMTFCFALLPILQQEQIPALASTTLRCVKDGEQGEKVVKFEFCQFRPYYIIS